MKRILLCALAFTGLLVLYADDAKQVTVEALQAEVATLKAENALLKAQQAWCQSELNIWANNPEIVQVRLNLQLESAKAQQREKAVKTSQPGTVAAVKPE